MALAELANGGSTAHLRRSSQAAVRNSARSTEPELSG